jgi:hypothetical protein
VGEFRHRVSRRDYSGKRDLEIRLFLGVLNRRGFLGETWRADGAQNS